MLCLWSVHIDFMPLCMVFNLWIGPGFIIEHFILFLFFSSHFPVTTFGLDLFSGAYPNKIMFLWGQVIENSSVTEVHQVRCFIP